MSKKFEYECVDYFPLRESLFDENCVMYYLKTRHIETGEYHYFKTDDEVIWKHAMESVGNVFPDTENPEAMDVSGLREIDEEEYDEAAEVSMEDEYEEEEMMDSIIENEDDWY